MPEENALGQEKTEQPTSRRRQKAREKGSVARSKEINSSIMLFFALCVLALYGPYMARALTELTLSVFAHFPEMDISLLNMHAYAARLAFFILKLLVPIFAIFMAVAVIANIAQFGFLYTTQTLFQGFKHMTLNPTKLIKRIFGTTQWVQLGINLGKLGILIIVAYHTIKNEIEHFPMLVHCAINDILLYVFKVLFFLALKVIMLLVILAILDFLWQKYKHESSMKMSKQEIKDEMKMVEGDPKIKRHIRSTMQRMALSHMIKRVPEADVVITNPFHIAVAVKYDPAAMNAPTVIAKGARLIAERIKELARWASIPIIENKPLAQTLYKTVEVGDEIPPKLYQAVAEILAYVYQLNKDKARRFASVS